MVKRKSLEFFFAALYFQVNLLLWPWWCFPLRFKIQNKTKKQKKQQQKNNIISRKNFYNPTILKSCIQVLNATFKWNFKVWQMCNNTALTRRYRNTVYIKLCSLQTKEKKRESNGSWYFILYKHLLRNKFAVKDISSLANWFTSHGFPLSLGRSIFGKRSCKHCSTNVGINPMALVTVASYTGTTWQCL